jgi:tetratricopeptide (TPR) repeat protein
MQGSSREPWNIFALWFGAIRRAPKRKQIRAGPLAETGNWKEARMHLERALALDPNHALALENLEQVQRESPRDPP